MPEYLSVKAVASGGGFSLITALSDVTVSMLLALISESASPEQWTSNPEPSAALLDEIDAAISSAMGELMTHALIGAILPFIGEIPDGLLLCDGAEYGIAEFPLLADALGPTFETSLTRFVVPDLRGLFVAYDGAPGAVQGASEYALGVDQLPPHTHTYSQYSFGIDIESVGVPDPTGVGQPSVNLQTSSTGNGALIDNRPSFMGVRYAIVAR